MTKHFLLLFALVSSAFGTCSSTAFGSFTCVQPCHGNTFGATSQTCAFGSNLGSGHFVYGVASGAAATVLTVGTSCGVTWTIETAKSGQVAHFWGLPSSGACTITLSSTNSTGLQVHAVELSGGTLVDGTAHGIVDAGFFGGGSLVSQSMTTATNGDFALYGFMNYSNNGAGTIAGDAPTLLLDSSTSFGIGVAGQVQSTAGAITNSVSGLNSGNSATAVLALKVTSGGGAVAGQFPRVQ